MTQKDPIINEARFLKLLTQLGEIGRQADGAVHRPAYSTDDMAARDWLEDQVQRIGLRPERDVAGNSLALYPGLEDLPPIAIGSHSDSVPYGGAYDGALGVITALETILALHDGQHRLRHPVMWINFAAEESTMASGTTGSQAMAGIFQTDLLDRAAWDGRPVREHLMAAGLDPQKLPTAGRDRGEFAAFLECHIEQSDRLEQNGVQIGIVDGFVGIRRYAVTFQGVANHAGTTPMARRHDALVMAAPLIQTVRDIAIEFGIVGTVGDFSVYPGAPNVIPERVELVVELRGLQMPMVDQAETMIATEARRLGGRFEPIMKRSAIESDIVVRHAIENACRRLSLSTLAMPSGAGHDAVNMAHLCPQGIFFVPSKDGISHSKDEYTSAEDCLNAARVMLEAVLQLDQTLSHDD